MTSIAPLVVNIYLGLRPREIFLPRVQYLACERSERDTIRGVQIRAGAVGIYMYLYHLTSHLMQAIGPKVWIK